jgi:phage terminase large subunit
MSTAEISLTRTLSPCPSESFKTPFATRLIKLRKLRELKPLQEQVKALCARDIVYFVNEFCWTYDPREKPSMLPFVLFDKQADFLRWLQEREESDEDGIAEKCRDVGFTWLCCAYAVHGWLFREGFRCGFGSRKLELVDELGNPACIFEKMRLIIGNLPKWMLPREYSLGYCKILNQDNGASISGEGGDNIGRGDRTSMYFVDEAAFLERSQKIDAALSQTSRCKIWVSTPNGMGNAFYRKRFSGVFPVFTFNWRDDPRKGDAWYEYQKKTLDEVTLAQEVDIDYSASVEGICIPAKWVRAAVDLQGLPENGPLRASLDIAAEGGDENVLGFMRGAVLQPLSNENAWKGVSTTYTATKAREECERRNAANLNFDNGGGYGEPVAQMGKIPGLRFEVTPLNGGDTPSQTRWPDGRTSQEKFVNARAEWWWTLRERFRKTWEYVHEEDEEKKSEYSLDELISIPNHPTLIQQLSLPLAEPNETGKIRIESKKKMRARGVSSPDYADMLAMMMARPKPGAYSF